ncbi:hypothetical protein Pcinc_037795 [Petrolisthes cinctipes]|uniref:C2H2-type domain-containing protein n=1 Tax=Petrolisthes cinctipes TaxID=88211 RepID=A0AAE1BS81_PETCI|nr:hypothetical protein Pcinc_037795 [Petrolisthes cinctipes]
MVALVVMMTEGTVKSPSPSPTPQSPTSPSPINTNLTSTSPSPTNTNTNIGLAFDLSATNTNRGLTSPIPSPTNTSTNTNRGLTSPIPSPTPSPTNPNTNSSLAFDLSATNTNLTSPTSSPMNTNTGLASPPIPSPIPSPPPTNTNSSLAFDLSATYTQIIQQVAAKIYPYDPASVVASLAALGPASHLPLALTAPHALSLTAGKVAMDAEKSMAALTVAGLPLSGGLSSIRLQNASTGLNNNSSIRLQNTSSGLNNSSIRLQNTTSGLTNSLIGLTRLNHSSSGLTNTPIRLTMDSKVKVEDDVGGSTASGESALDLRTQGLKSLYSSYRRAGLDDIKPKVVEDIWVENDVRLSWTDSRLAAYNPAQKLFMCVDCECVGFLSRVAEHWLGAHANLRVFACPRCPYTSAWSRCVKMHLTRQHNEQFADINMWKENSTLMEVTRLMQELRNKVENRIDSTNTLADKRFYCPHCPYATDRRDLYTRHENIHKDDKPFHCYLCFKQFNRADHVKKHFVRMHPDLDYDISKIRKHQGTTGRASAPVVVRGGAGVVGSLQSSYCSPVEKVGACKQRSVLLSSSPVPASMVAVVSVPSPPQATPAVAVEEKMDTLTLTTTTTMIKEERREEEEEEMEIEEKKERDVEKERDLEKYNKTPLSRHQPLPSSTPSLLCDSGTPLGLGATRAVSPSFGNAPMTRRRKRNLAERNRDDLNGLNRCDLNREERRRVKEEAREEREEEEVLDLTGRGDIEDDDEEEENDSSSQEENSDSNRNRRRRRKRREPIRRRDLQTFTNHNHNHQMLTNNQLLTNKPTLTNPGLSHTHTESPEPLRKTLKALTNTLVHSPRSDVSPEPLRKTLKALTNTLVSSPRSDVSPEPLRKTLQALTNTLVTSPRSDVSPEPLQKTLQALSDSPEPLRKTLQALTNTMVPSPRRTESPETPSILQLRTRRRGDRAYSCPYCNWSGSDNWCLKRHMNTHIKPFACIMCDYKAARAERLSTHVLKVHNKRICNKCNFLAETQERLLEHTREEHHNNPYSRRYICSFCVLTFDTRPALETHQHLSHPTIGNNTNPNVGNTLPNPREGSPTSYPEQEMAHDLSLKGESKCVVELSLKREMRGSSDDNGDFRSGGDLALKCENDITCPVKDCEYIAHTTSSLCTHLHNTHPDYDNNSSCTHTHNTHCDNSCNCSHTHNTHTHNHHGCDDSNCTHTHTHDHNHDCDNSSCTHTHDNHYDNSCTHTHDHNHHYDNNTSCTHTHNDNTSCPHTHNHEHNHCDNSCTHTHNHNHYDNNTNSCTHTHNNDHNNCPHTTHNNHYDNNTSSCPHCGYQLTHDELSRDHWLTHHSEVCAVCVRVFTAVYGPQLWKKVHVRHGAQESPALDAIVSGLNRKRTAYDGLSSGPLKGTGHTGPPVTVVAPVVPGVDPKLAPVMPGVDPKVGPIVVQATDLRVGHSGSHGRGLAPSPTNTNTTIVSAPNSLHTNNTNTTTNGTMVQYPTNTTSIPNTHTNTMTENTTTTTTNTIVLPHRDTPSPESDGERLFGKRSRKQSRPKKVPQLRGHMSPEEESRKLQ